METYPISRPVMIPTAEYRISPMSAPPIPNNNAFMNVLLLSDCAWPEVCMAQGTHVMAPLTRKYWSLTGWPHVLQQFLSRVSWYSAVLNCGESDIFDGH